MFSAVQAFKDGDCTFGVIRAFKDGDCMFGAIRAFKDSDCTFGARVKQKTKNSWHQELLHSITAGAERVKVNPTNLKAFAIFTLISKGWYAAQQEKPSLLFAYHTEECVCVCVSV